MRTKIAVPSDIETVTMSNAGIDAAIGRRAWESRFYAIPESARKVPTMLTPEERRMMSWIGEHAYTGAGAVCDMGCFLGGSTAHLAAGLAQSGKPWRMHSYDRFEISEELKAKYLYSAGYPRFDGKDMYPVFQRHIAGYASNIEAHRGEFMHHPWADGPIEILFNDIAKTVDLNNFILKHFFSALIPGRSIVIQQDYIFPITPWLITTMEILHPKLELIGWTHENSALFRCNEACTGDDLAAADFSRLQPADVERLILRARDRFPFAYQREMFEMALEAYKSRPHVRQSWGYPDVVRQRINAASAKPGRSAA